MEAWSKSGSGGRGRGGGRGGEGLDVADVADPVAGREALAAAFRIRLARECRGETGSPLDAEIRGKEGFAVAFGSLGEASIGTSLLALLFFFFFFENGRAKKGEKTPFPLPSLLTLSFSEDRGERKKNANLSLYCRRANEAFSACAAVFFFA